MDLFEAIRARASVRAYEPCEITDQELSRILDAGRRAPSGMNRQPWHFIVVRDKATLSELGKIQACIADACAAIAVVVDADATRFWKEDGSAAIENMLLAIVALGYGSVWVEGYGPEQEEHGKRVLSVPAQLRLLAILPIGRPAGEVSQAQKKPLSEIAHIEAYGAPWPSAEC